MTFIKLNKCPRLTVIFTLPLVFFFLIGMVSAPAFGADPQARKIWDALTYLKAVPEITWLDIEGTNVILAWKSYPPNFSKINKTAVKKASRKVRGEVTVYSVKDIMKGWRPGKDAPPHLCHSLAEKGRLKFTNCR